MNRGEFEALRDLPDKEITEDIIFTKKNTHTFVFKDVRIKNSIGVNLVVDGTFKPDFPSIIYNFSVEGVGPVCRVCVNNTVHGDSGRTHKHDLKTEKCPQKNLRHGVAARPDLESLTAKKVWDILCMQANIKHTGNFIEPSEVK